MLALVIVSWSQAPDFAVVTAQVNQALSINRKGADTPQQSLCQPLFSDDLTVSEFQPVQV